MFFIRNGLFIFGFGSNFFVVSIIVGLVMFGVVGLMIGDFLSLLGVEKVMKEMEGGKEKEGEELKEKFVRLGRREGKSLGLGFGVVVGVDGVIGGERVRNIFGGIFVMLNEVLYNFVCCIFYLC